jgi:hypothetical protein
MKYDEIIKIINQNKMKAIFFFLLLHFSLWSLAQPVKEHGNLKVQGTQL